MKRTSYHNHSNWSDGEADLETMVRAAKDAGLTEFGISDHWVETPWEPTEEDREWRMEPSRLPEYCDTLLALKRKYDDDTFTLRLGLEVDYFEQNVKEVVGRLSEYPLDYIIGSIHFAGDFSVDHDIKDWLPLDQEQINRIWHGYWRSMAGLCDCGLFDIIGHLDLPKKYAYFPTYDYLDEAETALRALKESKKALELNTAGWYKNCRNSYPGEILLMRAYQLCIPVILSADAHVPENVCRDFDRAEEVLKLAGYEPVTWKFEKRVRSILE